MCRPMWHHLQPRVLEGGIGWSFWSPPCCRLTFLRWSLGWKSYESRDFCSQKLLQLQQNCLPYISLHTFPYLFSNCAYSLTWKSMLCPHSLKLFEARHAKMMRMSPKCPRISLDTWTYGRKTSQIIFASEQLQTHALWSAPCAIPPPLKNQISLYLSVLSPRPANYFRLIISNLDSARHILFHLKCHSLCQFPEFSLNNYARN